MLAVGDSGGVAMYRVWAYNKRRTAMFVLSWKHTSNNDKAHTLAVWATRDGARKYMQRNSNRAPYGYMVLKEDSDAE